MNIKYKKVIAGIYEVFGADVKVGSVVKDTDGRWRGVDLDSEIEVEAGTRKDAAAALIEKVQEEQEEPMMTHEEMCKQDLQSSIDGKIRKTLSGHHNGIWIGADHYDLEGSKLLDFIEFMYLDTWGAVYDYRSFEKHSAYIAEDDPDCSAEDHEQNFVGTWADYKRKWQQANLDQLCECCMTKDVNMFGSAKLVTLNLSKQTEIVRMINCQKCHGHGIKIEPKQCKECGEDYLRNSSSDSGSCIKCEVESVKEETEKEIAASKICSECDGSGIDQQPISQLQPDDTCSHCEGSGEEPEHPDDHTKTAAFVGANMVDPWDEPLSPEEMELKESLDRISNDLEYDYWICHDCDCEWEEETGVAAEKCITCGSSRISCAEDDDEEELEIEPIKRGEDDMMETSTNVNRALYEMKDGGQCRVDDEVLKDLITQELDEMEILYIVSKNNGFYYITQTDPEEMDAMRKDGLL